MVLNKTLDRSVRMSALALFNEIVLNSDQDQDQYFKIMEKMHLAYSLGQEFLPISSSWSDANLIRKQLYYIQCWSLNKYRKLMHTSVDSKENLSAVTMIREIRNIAFKIQKKIPGVGTIQRNRHSEDYKTLGFECTVDPTQDFKKPPGTFKNILKIDRKLIENGLKMD